MIEPLHSGKSSTKIIVVVVVVVVVVKFETKERKTP